MATSSSPLLSSSLGSVTDARESDDEPLDVGWVRPPVAGVAAEDELPAALEPLDEERAASDGSTRPRIVDPVAPDLREVRTAERVRRQDVPEESPPGREPRPQNHSHGLAINGTGTADGGVEFTQLRGTVTAYRPQREDEVLRRDRDSVAPARLRTDVVGQREWSPPREVDPRDEAFLEREVGTDLERRLQNLLDPVRAAQAAVREQDVETGGLGADHAKDERAAALRRLRGRAARSRDREERDGDRRGEGYSASHQFSAFQAKEPTPFGTTPRTVALRAIEACLLVERDGWHGLRQPRVDPVQERDAAAVVENARRPGRGRA